MSYRFHPGAEAEHFEAIAFYESRQIGLGAAYLTEFEETMEHVVQVPHRYRIERKPNIRVSFGKRFCYVGALVLGGEVLLGAIPMDDMDLVVNPANREITVDPASPDIPHARVK